VIEVPHIGKVHALCVHLGLLEADRARQVRSICERIQSHVPENEPLIIGGDFNDWKTRVSATLRQTLEVEEAFHQIQGKHARTFPSWLPALRLDRIYYRGMKPRRANCLNGKPWSELSDHIALCAEFNVK
jgi:endonuclease/exonuclease/phosphatase family metal-dependent hydrolase